MALPDTLRMKVPEGRDGVCRFDLTVEEIHHNVEGMLHGGVISTMIDIAIARAIRSLVPADIEIMTIALNVNFFGTLDSGVVEVTGRTVFSGKRLIHGEAEVRVGERLLARGNGTWYARPRRPAAAPAR